MDISKRSFLRGAAAVPVLGAFVGKAGMVQPTQAGLAQAINYGGAASALTGPQQAGNPVTHVPWMERAAHRLGISLDIFKRRKEELRDDQVRADWARYYREGPFDLTIGSMRSWSHAARAHHQRLRDEVVARDLQRRSSEIYSELD